MRPILIIAMLACGYCAADQAPPKNIRVCVQFIEVPHPMLTEMLAGDTTSGPALREKAFALSKEGTAKILETCVVVGHSNQKATIESLREVIYPVEYEPPEYPQTVIRGATPEELAAMELIPPTNPAYRSGNAFESRNIGVSLEIEPTLKEDGTIKLKFVPAVVNLIRLETWMEYIDQWGDASIRMPVFETWRVNTTVALTPGQIELVSVLSPKTNAAAPAVPRKILVFVRADIVPPSTGNP